MTGSATLTVPGALRAGFSGALLEPGDPRYGEAAGAAGSSTSVPPSSLAVTRPPTCDAVELGRLHNREISVRSCAFRAPPGARLVTSALGHLSDRQLYCPRLVSALTRDALPSTRASQLFRLGAPCRQDPPPAYRQ
jgi:hypothetical protein